MRKRVILFIFVELLLISSLSLFTVFAAKKKNPWDQKPDGSCARGALCKGLVAANSKTAKNSGCHAAGTEGGRTDFRDDAGNFCYSVQNPKKEKEVVVVNPTATPTPVPTATPTPTPNPTATPTPTPTPGPTATPTPTPTPAPPQVIVVREAPKQLPPTGFPTDAVAGGAIVSGSLGWFIFRRFRA